jgi:serine/threonine-protein kinase HipA
MNNDARVILWGSVIGAVTWLEDREIGVFQYAPDFLRSGIQLSPLMMPLGEFPYEFPALARNTFKGLPGLVADSLPDKYGNAIIDAVNGACHRRSTFPTPGTPVGSGRVNTK